MEWHPASKIFPMLTDDSLHELADDIRANGLQNPILLDTEDRVIDGRNRLAACQIAGVEPVFEVHQDESTIVETVISLNLKRRHLTSSQRAVVAAKAKDVIKAERDKAKERRKRKPKSVPQIIGEQIDDQHANETDQRIAEQFGTNRQYVADACKVAKHDEANGTDLLDQVFGGKITLQEAKAAIARPAPQSAEATAEPTEALTFEEALAKAVRCKKVTAAQLCDWMGKSKATGDVRKAMQALSKAAGFEVQKVDGEANTWTVSRVDHSIQGVVSLFERFATREKLEILKRLRSDPEVRSAESKKQTLKMRRGDEKKKAHEAAAERAMSLDDAVIALNGQHGQNLGWVAKALNTKEGRDNVSFVLMKLRSCGEKIQQMKNKLERRCEDV